MYLYIYIYLCVCAQSLSHVWLFTTPWTIASQAPLPMGFSRQEYWSQLPFLPPRDPPNPGITPHLLHLLHWQVDSLPLRPGKSLYIFIYVFYITGDFIHVLYNTHIIIYASFILYIIMYCILLVCVSYISIYICIYYIYTMICNIITV